MHTHVEHLRSIVSWSLFVSFLSAVGASSLHGADDLDGKRRLVTFIKESYQANLDSFEFCRCKFVHIKGFADSREAALKGQVKNSIIRDGTWIYNGQKTIHELKCRERFNPKGAALKPGIMGLSCGGEGGLTNGTIILYYSPEGSMANIWSTDNSNRTLDIYWTPFTVGIMGKNGSSNPARLMEEALRGEIDWDVTQPSVDRNDSRVTFVFGKGGLSKTSRMEINLEKGCLTEFKTGCYFQTTKRMYEMHITDILQCSKERWFPKRTVIMWDPDDEPPYRVDIVEVTKLDVDMPPTESEFVLHLPPGVQVSEIGASDSLYRTRTSESISVNDLDSVLSRCRNRATRLNSEHAPEPGRRRPWILGVLFLVGLLFFLYGYRKVKGRLFVSRPSRN